MFGNDVDYAIPVKTHGDAPEAEKQYNLPPWNGAKTHHIEGRPDPAQSSMSYVERHDLTMRMAVWQFARPTNAFSMKVEHHAHAVALQLMYYTLAHIHKTLRITPAMAAGVTDRL